MNNATTDILNKVSSAQDTANAAERQAVANSKHISMSYQYWYRIYIHYLKCENNPLNNLSVKQETHSRRENLVFIGIKEVPTESEFLCQN